jgi:hypothetical protein
MTVLPVRGSPLPLYFSRRVRMKVGAESPKHRRPPLSEQQENGKRDDSRRRGNDR